MIQQHSLSKKHGIPILFIFMKASVFSLKKSFSVANALIEKFSKLSIKFSKKNGKA